MLGLHHFERHGFLKERKICDHAYDVEDLERDLKTLRSGPISTYPDAPNLSS